MEEFCIIGDELTVTGMKLIGVKNCYIADKENVRDILENAVNKFAIVAITHSLSKHVKNEIERIRANNKIIVEIPDREGGGEDTLRKLVRDVIGFELKKQKQEKFTK
ncbi:MAG: hypothetical protein DRO90_00860 [Candidatus Altiarchaeales archaeon]|nr:MAG: hypothetical protein DRO95_01335 [Candidatus Altiarchaeales archaeon]RLI95083.1 MAG: hypothetical protein DRO94_01385 [Candidatus Altiarchaeales archaeon]RLI95116.1 MAG: hypothetical protein DRO90_00860 [Candidatus Altiarchaeales archaeon]HDO82200.1 hypothetical protein [Candidatus Altiarchaeales archaeon]HEX54849.1 hypothetical protein [Candidatus Altiarchaeales archaeon]